MSIFSEFNKYFQTTELEVPPQVNEMIAEESRLRSEMIGSYVSLFENKAMQEIEQFIDRSIDENEPAPGIGSEAMTQFVFTQYGLKLVKKRIASMRHALQEAVRDGN